MKNRLLATVALTVYGLTSAAEGSFEKPLEIPVCASAMTAKKVQATYQKLTGAPLAVVSRVAGVPEVQVATGLPKESRVAIKATPDIVKKLWAGIDAWGRETNVRVVFTMGGEHVLDFPSMVPTTQVDLDDGWIDIYADEGRGVHGHLWLDRIHSIHAVDIPGRDAVRTRTISFYGVDGKLIMGLYASISTKKFDPAAVDGFARTRAEIAAMPQICD